MAIEFAMLFWLTAISMTLAACLAVLVPVLRRPVNQEVATDHDLEVYKDQLAEVDRDVERGLIGPAEAEQARAEIGRRILRLAGEGEKLTARIKAGLLQSRRVAMSAVLAVPLISWGVYSLLGSPDLPSRPLQARLEKSPNESTIEELIARTEAYLAANPSDGRGWEVLAPVYLRVGRPDDAVIAFRNAIRLNGATADREAGLGEAVAMAAGGIVSTEAQAAFERALQLQPGHPKSRFYLATALAQEGKLAEASSAWQAMIAELPPDSPWRDAVKQALAEAERQTAAAGAESPARGPSQEDIESAEKMSPADRAAMIEAMVADLDQRLRDNPRDVEGWRRLLRSYVVLKNIDAARAALKRGVAAFGPESEEARELKMFAQSIGVTETE